MNGLFKTALNGGFVLTLLLSLPGIAAQAQVLNRQEALNQITDFASRNCPSVPTEGHSESVEASGDFKADLARLVAKLANMGFSGTAKFRNESYSGVPQADISASLRDVMNCRERLASLLVNKLIDSQKSSANGTTNSFSGVNNGALIQSGNGSRITILNPVSRSQEALSRAQLKILIDNNKTKLSIRSARVGDWAGINSPVLILGVTNETDRTATNIKITVPQIATKSLARTSFNGPHITLEGKQNTDWPVLSVDALTSLYRTPNVSILGVSTEKDFDSTLSMYGTKGVSVNARGVIIQIDYTDVFGRHKQEFVPVIVYSMLT